MSAVLADTRVRPVLEQAMVELTWRRWRDDPVAFFREAVQIQVVGARTGRGPLDLWDYQQATLEVFRDSRYVVVLKARQLGLTTLVMAYALWLCLFRPGSNILLVSKDQRTADKMLGEHLDFMWRFLPDWALRRAPSLETNAAREHIWRFHDGMTSRIVSLPATKTAGAGETATLVLWDEAALATDQEDTFRTLHPTTDAGGSMIVFSTARGGHNRFARLCREAQQNENEFELVFHPWYVSRLLNPKAEKVTDCPTTPCSACVDHSRYEEKKKAFKDEPWRFYAEYPTTIDEAFRQSGHSRFTHLLPVEDHDSFDLRGYLTEEDGRLVVVEDNFGPLRLRSEALHGAPSWAKSVLAVDPASGVGGDYTAMSGGWLDEDGVPQRMAFWRANDIEPVDAAQDAAQLGRFLSGDSRAALLAVEKQGGWGETTIHELRHNISYPNLYVHVYTGHRRTKRDTTYGFPMTKNRRPLVIDRLAQWLDFDDPDALVLEGIDPLLRHELGAFVVTDTGRVEADVGMNDDLVMSTAIWLYVLTELVGMGATDAHIGEDTDTDEHTHTLTLAHMWDEIEAMWRKRDRKKRRRAHRFQRKLRRRSRKM